jgi:hypothetical protein
MSYKHSKLHHKCYESIPDSAPARVAEVWKVNEGWLVVKLFRNEVYDIVTLFNHSEQYAENCAENFTLGIGQDE